MGSFKANASVMGSRVQLKINKCRCFTGLLVNENISAEWPNLLMALYNLL
uniref:Uncharacterized protein n=1 Tax=Octopus bimaculoides TaxID=37653 RepID=A0A0L8GHG0_OCTBM